MGPNVMLWQSPVLQGLAVLLSSCDNFAGENTIPKAFEKCFWPATLSRGRGYCVICTYFNVKYINDQETAAEMKR